MILEKYPIKTVLIFWIVNLLSFVFGFYIISKLNLYLGVLYIIYILILEFKVYKEGCVICCYYGKRCAFGRGLIASKFFKKGDNKKFCDRKLSWKGMIPEILVLLIPIVIGVYFLVKDFNYLMLVFVIYLALIWFVFNALFYGKLACCYCKQGSICCPAKKFFNK